tara:strand:+ start:230 stop:601 length:372 start_codon:yes stop_codon:yes gene_type:complete
MRARLALAVAGQRCELREVKLSAKRDAMLAASPKGTDPVLVLSDGAVIDENQDIMRWARGQNDPESWLGRDDPALIARNDGVRQFAGVDRNSAPCERTKLAGTPSRFTAVRDRYVAHQAMGVG